MKHPMISGLAVLVTSITVQGAEPTAAYDNINHEIKNHRRYIS